MASYLRIPESNIAGAVGTGIGKVTGVVVSTGNKSLDVVEELLTTVRQKNSVRKEQIRALKDSALQEAFKLEQIAVRSGVKAEESSYASFLERVTPTTISKFNVDSLKQESKNIIERAAVQVEQFIKEGVTENKQAIKKASATLNSIDVSLGTVQKAVRSLETIIATLQAPVAALKAAILVIKALPLPQRYLIVSFTILESDLLEMMTELVTQADEQIKAIRAILKNIDTSLEPLRERIRRIRALLEVFEVENLVVVASADDLDVLDEAGLYDKNTQETIFDLIQEGQTNGSSWLPYGNITLDDPIEADIENIIRLAEPGKTITVLGPVSGSFVEDYYKWQIDQPPYPKSRPELEGWSRYPGDPSDSREKLWRLSLLQNGNNIYGGYTSPIETVPDPEQLLETLRSYQNLQVSGSGYVYDPLQGYRSSQEVLILNERNFEEKPGILKPSSWSDLEIAALRKLKDLPLSQELQEGLSELYQSRAVEEASTSTLTGDAVTYRAKNGEIYYLRVVESVHSSKVAIQRYVEVRDSKNTVILEGIRTFSLDKDSLLEEMKLQLDQLTR